MAKLYDPPRPEERGQDPLGIVIQDRNTPPAQPVITAFIWGGKVRPVPTLPFGRWKPSAA